MYSVWHTKGRSVGGVNYAIVVQSYCNGVGVAGGRGNEMMIDSHNKALK